MASRQGRAAGGPWAPPPTCLPPPVDHGCTCLQRAGHLLWVRRPSSGVSLKTYMVASLEHSDPRHASELLICGPGLWGVGLWASWEGPRRDVASCEFHLDMTLGTALRATRTLAHPGHPAPCPPFWGHPSAAASSVKKKETAQEKAWGPGGRPAPSAPALADGRCFQGQDEEDRVPVHALQLGSARVEAGLQPAPLAGRVCGIILVVRPRGWVSSRTPAPGSPPPSSAPSFF